MESSAQAASTGQVEERSIRKVALISLVGSTIEWYDFFIYGTAAALVFGPLFFPGTGATGGTLLAFSTFALGFIARPIGGVIWGHFGDRIGRKRAFLAALITMATGTVLIGLMPTYAAIGVAAPILLTVLRFVQGLAVGGQWGGAVLMATEFAPKERRGYWASYAQIGVPVAVILSNVLFLILTAAFSPEFFASYGWRIPFLLSIVLIFVAIYAQRRLEDTPAFRHMQEAKAGQGDGEAQGRSPILEVLRDYPKQIALAAGAFIVINATFYIFITYMLDYGTTVLGLPETSVLIGILIAAVVQIFALAGFAALSDRVGRRKVYLAGAAGMALWSFPFFWIADTGTAVGVAVAIVVGQMFLSMMYGPQAALFAELFSVRVRYSGASLGYQIGAAFGGGFAPLIATALLAATGSSAAISAYMLVVSLLAFFCVLALAETHQRDLDDVEAPQPQSAEGSPATT